MTAELAKPNEDERRGEATTVEEGLAFANGIYPIAVCPQFALDELGKAANNQEELVRLLTRCLRKSLVHKVELSRIPAGLCLARRPRHNEGIRPSPNPVG